MALVRQKYFPGKRMLIVLAAAVLFTACAPRVEIRGNLPDPDLLAELEIGALDKRQVEEMFGSPSSVSTFGNENWYYISERTETTAFYAPEVVDRKVVVISFDDKGVIRDFASLGLEDGRIIELVERKTPTAGHEITFLQQLFGNLGRFEGGDDTPPGAPRLPGN